MNIIKQDCNAVKIPEILIYIIIYMIFKKYIYNLTINFIYPDLSGKFLGVRSHHLEVVRALCHL